MRIGAVSFNNIFVTRPDRLAQVCEEAGLESIWFPDHSHIPVRRDTDFALGGELPKEYPLMMEQLVSLSAAATATSRIKIATGICLLAQRDTILTAKAIATIDVISEGRVIFGVGGGWNREEMANHGTRFEDRWKILVEKINALKAIWANEEASYHGDFVNFDPIWCNPKPVQKPRPPIYLGAIQNAGFKRVVEHCDGWIVVTPTAESFKQGRETLRRMADEAGRDMRSIQTTAFLEYPLSNELLDQYAELGLDRAVMFLPPTQSDLLSVEHCAQFVERYR